MAIAFVLTVWRRRATTGQRNCYYFEIIINTQSFLSLSPSLFPRVREPSSRRLPRRRSVYEECKQRVTKRWAINRAAHRPYSHYYYVCLWTTSTWTSKTTLRVSYDPWEPIISTTVEPRNFVILSNKEIIIWCLLFSLLFIIIISVLQFFFQSEILILIYYETNSSNTQSYNYNFMSGSFRITHECTKKKKKQNQTQRHSMGSRAVVGQRFVALSKSISTEFV